MKGHPCSGAPCGTNETSLEASPSAQPWPLLFLGSVPTEHPKILYRKLFMARVCFQGARSNTHMFLKHNVVRISSEAVKLLLHIKCSYQHQYPSVGNGSFSYFIIFQTECVSGSSDMSSVQLLTVFFRNGTLPVSCVSLVSDSLLTVSTQPGNVSDSTIAGRVWL